MKLIIKICCSLILFAGISIPLFARAIVIDTSSEQDLVANPTIIMTPSTVKPDCHTTTGCGLIVVKPVQRYHVCHRACERCC